LFVALMQWSFAPATMTAGARGSTAIDGSLCFRLLVPQAMVTASV
jgi:hypothetical protein